MKHCLEKSITPFLHKILQETIKSQLHSKVVTRVFQVLKDSI